MRNLLSLLPILLLYAHAATAQLGIKGGLNLSSLYTNDEIIDGKQGKLGFQGGLVLELPITDGLSLQPEAIYIRKGANFNQSTTEVDARYDYIDMPLLLVIRPQLIPFFRLHIGPQVSYLADVAYEFRNAAGESEKDGNRDNYNTWDYGMALGASIHLDKLYLEARFAQGFRSVNKPRELLGVDFEGSDLKNFGLQLSVGLFLI